MKNSKVAIKVSGEVTAHVENIRKRIYTFRALHIMLDAEFAKLFGV